MKRFALVCAAVCCGFLLFSCASTGAASGSANTRKNAKGSVGKIEVQVYMLTTIAPDHTDYACLSINKGVLSGMTSYTVDRNSGTTQSLMVMEFGQYKIDGTTVTFKTENRTLVGTISDGKIVIDGDEYILQPTAKQSK